MGPLKRLAVALWTAVRQRKLLLESETAWFALASALDFIMTYIMLWHTDAGFIESNPIAVFFLHHWGLKGLFTFKLVVVTFVIVLCQIIARHNYQRARGVLYISTAIVSAVVIYSMLLHYTHTRESLVP